MGTESTIIQKAVMKSMAEVAVIETKRLNDAAGALEACLESIQQHVGAIEYVQRVQGMIDSLSQVYDVTASMLIWLGEYRK